VFFLVDCCPHHHPLLHPHQPCCRQRCCPLAVLLQLLPTSTHRGQQCRPPTRPRGSFLASSPGGAASYHSKRSIQLKSAGATVTASCILLEHRSKGWHGDAFRQVVAELPRCLDALPVAQVDPQGKSHGLGTKRGLPPHPSGVVSVWCQRGRSTFNRTVRASSGTSGGSSPTTNWQYSGGALSGSLLLWRSHTTQHPLVSVLMVVSNLGSELYSRYTGGCCLNSCIGHAYPPPLCHVYPWVCPNDGGVPSSPRHQRC